MDGNATHLHFLLQISEDSLKNVATFRWKSAFDIFQVVKKYIYVCKGSIQKCLYSVYILYYACLCFTVVFSAWLEAEDDPVIARVNQRIEDITGLTVDTAELLQVI